MPSEFDPVKTRLAIEDARLKTLDSHQIPQAKRLIQHLKTQTAGQTFTPEALDDIGDDFCKLVELAQAFYTFGFGEPSVFFDQSARTIEALSDFLSRYMDTLRTIKALLVSEDVADLKRQLQWMIDHRAELNSSNALDQQFDRLFSTLKDTQLFDDERVRKLFSK